MSRVVHRFTRNVPDWQPRVTPVDLAKASPEQLDALKVTPSNTKVSDYVLVLAHDPETLNVRSPLFNGIMYDPGGLSRAERELGAIGASVVNRCIYCAAVHAARHAQLSKDTAVTDELFANGEKARLGARDQAIFDYSVKLSQSPPAVTEADTTRLREAGLDEAEIVDLILSTALFGWANRLMHILGDPVRKDG
ncbi:MULTISPECIES: peroxidase-related enzyme [Bosea]|uniref:peroxidase-related enzyme n=1 Tax=Bosea TaxID=85413 RepID=UPI00214F8E86|nr:MULTISPECIES: peroxidase-related enzyme [Bosea]MCR4524568.1 peroxidase-related enzyme [Bosea sp. 47.2.35]MDR6829983.1 putative peroxidase-related enzyme [Bosea robiniae]MDR6896865.1 putative peroxidase-related enzyme [Bosea sp. BE109]MDR7140113.1 putative peroxidase-related enzyme [Bosea sp. BE168]MDR7176810.1 putative peroxidase-related enzyme [Bosea sp. BE271]